MKNANAGAIVPLGAAVAVACEQGVVTVSAIGAPAVILAVAAGVALVIYVARK